jgi:hypothetical protein
MRWLIVALIFVAGGANAEQLTRAQKQKLDAFKRAAERASAEGNFAETVAQLNLASGVTPNDPELALSLARAYDEWGEHCGEALAELQHFFSLCGSCALAARGKSEEGLIANRCASDVTIDSNPPGAIVQIAGEEFARAAPFTTQMKAGSYTIDVRRHGYIARHLQVLVEPATPQKVPVTLEIDPVLSARPAPKVELAPPVEPERATPIFTYAALGTGVAAGIAGAVFTMISLDAIDDERQARFEGANAGEISSLRSSARTHAALAYGGFGLALAGFATAVVFDILEE